MNTLTHRLAPKLLFAALTAALLLLTGACGADPTANKYEGSWATACIPDAGVGSFQMNIVIGPGSFTRFQDHYLASTTCADAVDLTDVQTALYTLPGTKTLPTSEGVDKLAYEDTRYTVTTHTLAAAIAATGLSLYGFTDWAPGVIHDVTSLNNDGSARTDLTGKQVLFLDGTFTPQRIYVGDDNGTLDAEGYPDTLQAFFFERL